MASRQHALRAAPWIVPRLSLHSVWQISWRLSSSPGRCFPADGSRVFDVRERVLALVQAHPGLHERELERRLGLASRLTGYHLSVLEASGSLRRVQDSGYSRFFPVDPSLSDQDLHDLCLLRRAPALRITVLLLSLGRAGNKALAQQLGLAKASVSYHLRLLVEAGVLSVTASGRHRHYELVEPTRIRTLLSRFSPLPEDLAPFEAVLDDLLRKDPG